MGLILKKLSSEIIQAPETDGKYPKRLLGPNLVEPSLHNSSQPNVEFRVILWDISDADEEYTTRQDVETWWAFFKPNVSQSPIMNATTDGWVEYQIPLEDNGRSDDNGGYQDGFANPGPGWGVGIAGNDALDIDQIGGMAIEIVISGNAVSQGEFLLEDIQAIYTLDVPGCMDETACNYDPAATVDSGLCYDCIEVEFSVDMNDVETHPDGVYFAGGDYGQEGFLMEDADEEDIWYVKILDPETEIGSTKNYKFRNEYIAKMIKYYVYLNPGLSIIFNGEKFRSENGLKDLIKDNNNIEDFLYPVIHLLGKDIEIAITHNKKHYSEEYYSFVNGQNTSQGGTHLNSFKEAIVKTIRDFFKKNYDSSDIKKSIISAISIKVMEPVFESQTKTKLGSTDMGGGLPTVRSYIIDFISKNLDNFLHKNTNVAEAIQRKIIQAERERKELSGIRKLARERARKSSLHNKKLRDCRVHLGDMSNEKRLESTIFITEGDSASGSITKSRDVNTQAVFSLRGKPLNSYSMTKKIVYENEEFNLLQAALNIEEGIEKLRYNKIVIATDADVDGMHIRLLIITFFLQFFPELIKEGHLFILQTPLFRVRNKNETIYCYSENEKSEAYDKLGPKVEITRFKGLGEISPNEFKNFIGDSIRLDPIIINKETSVEDLLAFYMGKNTPDRQNFIIENLKVNIDSV